MGRTDSAARALVALAQTTKNHKTSRTSLFTALEKDGVAVVDCTKHYSEWRTGALNELRALGDKVLWPAAGGFGGIGSPEFAVSKTGYAIDKGFFYQVKLVLSEAVAAMGGADIVKTAKARMFDDRFGIRPPTGWVNYGGSKWFRSVPSGESDHRDVSVVQDVDTATFGGFVNLGTRAQEFYCVPGSGFGASAWRSEASTGFSKFSQKDSLMWRKKMVRYVVPQGCAIIFDSTIVHKIAAGKSTAQPPTDGAESQVESADLRKYVSWWMTVSKKESVETPDITMARFTDRLARGLPPLLPSGQKLPFYPSNWSLHTERRDAFLAQFGVSASAQARFPHIPASSGKYPQQWREIYETEL